MGNPSETRLCLCCTGGLIQFPVPSGDCRSATINVTVNLTDAMEPSTVTDFFTNL